MLLFQLQTELNDNYVRLENFFLLGQSVIMHTSFADQMKRSYQKQQCYHF